MTLVAGFRCMDGGILICADREESGDGTKRSIDKIRDWHCRDAHFVFATSGTSAIVANLYERLAKALSDNEQNLLNCHKEVIGGVLRSTHEDFPEFDEWQEMVIAASFYRDVSVPIASFLYGTTGGALEAVPDYVCKGGGKDLARYFCHRLYEQWPSRRQAVILAAFVFREAEDHIEGVGRGTDMLYLGTKRRSTWSVPFGQVYELERLIPTIRETVAERWNNRLQIPEWLATDIYKDENLT